jgi:hypothetical protein
MRTDRSKKDMEESEQEDFYSSAEPPAPPEAKSGSNDRKVDKAAGRGSTEDRSAKAQKQKEAKAQRQREAKRAQSSDENRSKYSAKAEAKDPLTDKELEARHEKRVARQEARQRAMLLVKKAMKAEVDWLDDCWHQLMLTFNKLEQACKIVGADKEFSEKAAKKLTIRKVEAECIANIVKLGKYLDNPRLEGEDDSYASNFAGIGSMSGLYVHNSIRRHFMVVDFLQWLGGRSYAVDDEKGMKGPQIFAVYLLAILLSVEDAEQFQHKSMPNEEQEDEAEDEERSRAKASLPLKDQPRRTGKKLGRASSRSLASRMSFKRPSLMGGSSSSLLDTEEEEEAEGDSDSGKGSDTSDQQSPRLTPHHRQLRDKAMLTNVPVLVNIDVGDESGDHDNEDGFSNEGNDDEDEDAEMQLTYTVHIAALEQATARLRLISQLLYDDGSNPTGASSPTKAREGEGDRYAMAMELVKEAEEHVQAIFKQKREDEAPNMNWENAEDIYNGATAFLGAICSAVASAIDGTVDEGTGIADDGEPTSAAKRRREIEEEGAC